MPDDQPVMTALAEITAVSLLHSNLPAREHMIARLAALVAVDAPTASYVMKPAPRPRPGSPSRTSRVSWWRWPPRGHVPDRHRRRADHRGTRLHH